MAVLRSASARAGRPGALLAIFLLSSVFSLAWTAPVLAQPANLEAAVKANYLYKFAPFVEWPPRAYSTPNSLFIICVAGEDPFGKTLDEAVRGQAVGAHPIIVRRMATVQAGAACHILFLGKMRGQGAEDALRAVAGQPVLTVTDPARGVSGGMIQFVLRGGRVRFEIDEAAARTSGVAISSKLLGLAVSVKRAAT